jgi:predicted ATPase/class 3 adenylate cyclase
MLIAAYLPADRRQALARGASLPDRVHGAALFADISGFTPLTEALVLALGPRRGVDALTHHLNRIYDALIAEVDSAGGSVIGFSGDAITCWFDGQGLGDGGWGLGDEIPTPNPHPPTPAAQRAVACALALQKAMQRFMSVALPNGSAATVALKVVVTTGSARRFLVGDPSIQCLEVLAGAPVNRLGFAEHLARPGDVIVDQATVAALGGDLRVAEWRAAAPTEERYAIVAALTRTSGALEFEIAQPIGELAEFLQLNAQFETLQPWLPQAVYARLQAGLGEFLTELRPALALFLRFDGIEYEADGATAQLDTYIRWVQGVLARYGGTLLQITIGDKGSYLYGVFGAPIAHEDDARRAAMAAMELRVPPAPTGVVATQIGISQGSMRVGAFGGPTRRTYGVQGREANVAARLMQRAAPGEILVSGRVRAAGTAIPGVSQVDMFDVEPLAPIRLKGVPDPVLVFRLAGERERATRLAEPLYRLPIVGRVAELQLVGDRLALALQGHAQIAGITAEAGLGKSRLVAEVIRLARRKGLRVFGGACQSYGTITPYLVWGPIWRSFFDLDPAWSVRKQERLLAEMIGELAPARLNTLPLLGSLLGLSLPENDFTRTLEPQFRQSALHELLLECVRAAAHMTLEGEAGLLFVLEDLHWIDPASHDLLEQLAQAIADLPILIVLAYRPPELLRLQNPRVEALQHFTRVALAPLTADESEQVIYAKLAQLLPDRQDVVPRALIERVTAQAQGNPFYIEELLHYLRDRGIDPWDGTALAALEFPASLHTLVLSRIDELSEHQRATLRVASVVGRQFRFAWLCGAYPALGSQELLRSELNELARLELTPLDTPEPELAYLFKHIVTHDVAYESLPGQTQARLHEQLARYVETLDAELYLDLLAYHYDRSANRAKRAEYLRRAAEAAAARYANVEALEYLGRALDLAAEQETKLRYGLLLVRERIYDLQGNRVAQAADLQTLATLADTLEQDDLRAEAALRRASYAEVTGDYSAAISFAQQAVAWAGGPGPAVAHLVWGRALLWQSEYLPASQHLAQALAAARLAQERGLEATAQRALGAVAQHQGDYATARETFAQALQLYQTIGDRRGEGDTFNNLGIVAYFQGDYATARETFAQALQLYQTIGDRRGEGGMLNNLGEVAYAQGSFADAQAFYTQALQLYQAVDDRRGQSGVLSSLGLIADAQGDYEAAKRYYLDAVRLKRDLGERWSESFAQTNLALALHHLGDDLAAAEQSEQSLRIAREVGARAEQGSALTVLGHALAQLGQAAQAAAAYAEALELRRALEQPHLATEPQAGLARLAMQDGDLGQALEHVEGILAFLQSGSLDGAGEPFRVELTCYDVLQAAGDPRARTILDAAYARLQQRAGRIPDPATRRAFLDAIPHHRALAAAWAAEHN